MEAEADVLLDMAKSGRSGTLRTWCASWFAMRSGQFTRAQRLLRREVERGEPVFVSHLVLFETEWVSRNVTA